MECLDLVSEGNTKGNLAQSAFCLVRCLCLEILIVSASRSPLGQVPKKLEFGSSFSQSGGSLVSFLVDFLIIGSTLGALGANF